MDLVLYGYGTAVCLVVSCFLFILPGIFLVAEVWRHLVLGFSRQRYPPTVRCIASAHLGTYLLYLWDCFGLVVYTGRVQCPLGLARRLEGRAGDS